MAVDKAYAVPVRFPDRLFIGGEWVTPDGGGLIDVVQPATEDVWVRVAAAGRQDVSRAVAAARQAFDRGPWPRMTHAERAEWFVAHGGGYPVLVAEVDADVVAWASLSPYHPRPGYLPAVEDSVYVRHDRRAQGVGGKLLEELLARGSAFGHHTVIGMIAADQQPSLALHERFGFEKVAHLREVGVKLGRRLDVVFMQRML